MKVTKILILVASALASQGCVTYSNPYEPTGRVEYRGVAAHEEYGYDAGESIGELTIADAAYYPWWSIDYYYLGHHRYRPAYLGGPRLSYAYGYGVPPYYWPYYGFYSPFYYPHSYYAWYDPWYGWPRYGIGLNVSWNNIYWHTLYHDYVRRQRYGPEQGDYDVSNYGHRDRQTDVLTDARDRAYAGERQRQWRAGRNSRDVSLAPSAGNGDAGMEVRSRRERKIQESHIGPAPVQAPSNARRPARVISAPPPGQSIPVDSPAPVSSAPPMLRQVQPPPTMPGRPVRQGSSSAPVTSTPGTVRQVQPPRVRPGAPPRSAPVPPSGSPGPGDSGRSPFPEPGDGQRN